MYFFVDAIRRFSDSLVRNSHLTLHFCNNKSLESDVFLFRTLFSLDSVHITPLPENPVFDRIMAHTKAKSVKIIQFSKIFYLWNLNPCESIIFLIRSQRYFGNRKIWYFALKPLSYFKIVQLFNFRHDHPTNRRGRIWRLWRMIIERGCGIVLLQ